MTRNKILTKILQNYYKKSKNCNRFVTIWAGPWRGGAGSIKSIVKVYKCPNIIEYKKQSSTSGTVQKSQYMV